MNKKSLRLPAGAALAALLAAGAVSCGKGEDADKSSAMSPAAAVARAAKHSEELTSMHYRMTGSIPQQGRIEAEARLRIKPEMAMSMKVSVPGMGAGTHAEVRLIGKAMYVNAGEEAAKEMDGRTWIRFDTSGTEAGKQLDQLGAASQAEQNPAIQTTFLNSADDVKKVGTETVDGVRTTHYQGTVTLDTLEKSLKKEGRLTEEQRRKSIESYRKMGIDELTMDMWTDGDDRAKRFRMRGDADEGPLNLTATFLDYNKPVKVTAPPAAETMDLAEMLKELQDS
jgi:hypothetical protein